ncbi:MFS transporter [Sandarakinorhabdus limnophila]|uniref:MFS transporter n=1 Tax=Sandarakinorhabdus limnophila TaxID=210512 RepID=UPI0026F1E886|nr:MFS transporter [Sandarakinorhabdus limnophila]
MAAAAAEHPDKPGLGTRIAYGFGAGAYGVKDGGFSYFLLLFYSQVIGVDARLVGLAITIALAIDAVADPIIGYWSDNLRSRWGRRHPFLYASALPTAATYFLIWDPPAGWSQTSLFWYLLGLATLIRISISFYEIPSTALGPELARSYDERSALFGWRLFFAWVIGSIMTVANFTLIFPAFVTAAIPNGQFNRDSYQLYGMIASVLIFVAIMISALGTHGHIKHMRAAQAKRALGLKAIFGEIFETIANRDFSALFMAALFGAIATGISASLSFYFSAYFWGFSSEQIGLITMSVFLSAAIGGAMSPVVSRTLGKQRGAVVIGLLAGIVLPLPIILRLFGLLPPNGDPAIFWIVFFVTMIDVGLIICFQALTASMLADLVEQAEVRTGRRNEGIFFAANTFIRKAVQGLGVMAASFVLTLAQFPKGANPSQVPGSSLWQLGATYVPAIWLVWALMIFAVSRYRLSRAGHEANLATLAERG